MGYTNKIATMKWWDRRTKKLKYCSYEKFDEHSNKFSEGRSKGFELMLGTNISTLPPLKIYLSDHPFIKDNIFEVNVNFTSRGTPIGIILQYCEHHNMSYIYYSKKNTP